MDVDVSPLRKLLGSIFGGKNQADRVLQEFQRHRQELQENCIAIASTQDKPRGLRWTNCEWLDSFALVEDPSTRILTLFCGVNLSFEAIEGGDMEDVEAVSMVRDATAVFHHQNQRWGTGGRVLFNMTPMSAAELVATGQTMLKNSG